MTDTERDGEAAWAAIVAEWRRPAPGAQALAALDAGLARLGEAARSLPDGFVDQDWDGHS